VKSGNTSIAVLHNRISLLVGYKKELPSFRLRCCLTSPRESRECGGALGLAHLVSLPAHPVSCDSRRVTTSILQTLCAWPLPNRHILHLNLLQHARVTTYLGLPSRRASVIAGRNIVLSAKHSTKHHLGDHAVKGAIRPWAIDIMSWKRSERLMDTIKVRNAVSHDALVANVWVAL
jgi:hypothetical protein